MRSMLAPELALWRGAAGYDLHVRFEVTDALGAWRDATSLSDVNFFDQGTWSGDVDNPTQMATFTLRRVATLPDGSRVSLAPLVTNSAANSGGPLLAAGRGVRLWTAYTARGVAPSSEWRLVFLGAITHVDPGGVGWERDGGTVTVTALDAGRTLAQAWVEDETEYGSESGVPAEQVVQQVLTEWMGEQPGGVPALVVPASPNVMLRTFRQPMANVLEAVRTIVMQFGWEFRYRWTGATTFQPVLYAPRRSTGTADAAFSQSEYRSIERLDTTDDDVRNVVRVKFVDRDTGEIDQRTSVGAASVAKYGRRFMEIAEERSSVIDTGAEAQAMADAARLDLEDPLADHDVTLPYFWPVEVGDVYEFGPNGELYDTAQRFGVVGWTHTVSADGSGSTMLRTRGKPVGQYKDWLTAAGAGPTAGEAEAKPFKLENFREIRRDALGVTYGWDDGELPARGFEIWWFRREPEQPVTVEPWPDEDDEPEERLPATARELTITYPPVGRLRYDEVRPMAKGRANADGSPGLPVAGESQRVKTLPVGAPPRFGALTQNPAASGLFTDLSVEVVDPQGFGGILRAWLNHNQPEHADPTAAPDGTYTVLGTPDTVNALDVWTTPGGAFALFDNVRVHPGRGKRIFLEFTNSKGVSTGQRDFTLLSQGGIIDGNGTIVDAAINAARQFASSLRPPRILNSLPPDGVADGTAFEPGEQAVLVNSTYPGGRLYRWDGTGWVAVVNTVDLVGQIVAAQVAAGAIETAAFAAGIQPVRFIPNLSASGSPNELAINLADGQPYWYRVGRGWINDTPSTSIVGQLTSAQLAAASVTATQLAAGAVTAPAIAASSIGAVAIAAGAITAGKLAVGAVQAGNISAGAVTAGIIAAGAVSATELAAGAITTPKLAALAVTADKIAANSITAGKIAADAIFAFNIASSQITADKLAANSVTAASIAAGAVTATAIAAKAVKATHLEVEVLSDIKNSAGQSIGLGIIVSARLQSVDGQRYLDLNAAGSSAFLYHPQMRLNADGTASFGGTITTSNFATGNASFSGTLTVGAAGGFGSGVHFRDPGNPFSTVAQVQAFSGGSLSISASGSVSISGPSVNLPSSVFTSTYASFPNLTADFFGVTVTGGFRHTGSTLAFFGGFNASKQTITGGTVSDALRSLLIALDAGYGLINNFTSF